MTSGRLMLRWGGHGCQQIIRCHTSHFSNSRQDTRRDGRAPAFIFNPSQPATDHRFRHTHPKRKVALSVATAFQGYTNIHDRDHAPRASCRSSNFCMWFDRKFQRLGAKCTHD